MRTLTLLFPVLLACGGNVQEPSGGEMPGGGLAPLSAKPEWLANASSPVALAAADGRVYVTTRTSAIQGEASANGSLLMLREPGVSPLMLAQDRFGAAFEAIAADTKAVHWSTSDGRILAIDTLGGEPRTLAQESGTIAALAIDAEHVYYTVTVDAASHVKRMTRDGSQVESLAEGLSGARGIAVAGRSVYVTLAGSTATGGSVLRIDAATKQAETVAQGLMDPCGVATAQGPRSVVWTERSESEQGGLRGSCALVTDGLAAFVGSDRAVRKASLMTGAASDWSAQAPTGTLGSLAIDARYVYWISGSTIVRSAK